jgi:hypothetical protein
MNTENTSEQSAVAAAVENLFVTVPETTLPNGTVVPAFQVAKYFASRGDDGQLVISATNKPLNYIDYHAARQACIDAGFTLLTETQALAIAVNIAGVAANWSGGAVGEGDLLQACTWTQTTCGSRTPATPCPPIRAKPACSRCRTASRS